MEESNSFIKSNPYDGTSIKIEKCSCTYSCKSIIDMNNLIKETFEENLLNYSFSKINEEKLKLNISYDHESLLKRLFKLKLNILYYDESLLVNNDLSDICADFQINIKGTFYVCHTMKLLSLVSEKIKKAI